MKIVGLDSVPGSKVEMDGARGVMKQLPLSSADGSPTFSFRVFTIEPGGHTPYHQHPFEHMNYVISGSGSLVSGPETEHPIKQGDFALVLPGEIHQFRNTSADAPLVIICAVPKEFE